MLVSITLSAQTPLPAPTPPSGDPTARTEFAHCSAHARVELARSEPAHLSQESVPRAGSTSIAPGISASDRLARSQHAASTPGSISASSSLVGPPCTAADFAALSGPALVSALAASSDACLGTLWTFDADVAQVVAGSTIDLVSAEISTLSLDLVTNSLAVERLTYFFQIAFFHEFFEGSVTYSPATFLAAQTAMMDVGAALDLTPPAVSSLDLIQQWTTTADSTNASVLVLPEFEAILARYNGDPGLAAIFQERLIVYNVLFSLARQVGNQCAEGASSPWYSAISAGLFGELETLALDTTYTPDDEYLVTNALWVVSRFECLDTAIRAQAHALVSLASQTHVQFSAAWLRAIADLVNQFDGELFDGTPIDLAAIEAQVRAIALPNEYVFDQGRLIFQTAIAESVARELVDAMQEVESQFFRKGGELSPVPGDDHEVLTLVIYGSPEEYADFQPFLYGLGTNNGGIFIENWGTLFTYDRTPQQSIFTLEELLRHEYVHYLDSRYLIVGSFGEAGTLYEGNRLVWYNEGLAEYLAGSSRTQGVLTRRILPEQIVNDPVRMTVAEIVSATYGSFTFYRYAGMLFRFLELERPDLFFELFRSVRGDDVVVLDALYVQMANDPILQADYDQFLTDQIAFLPGGTVTYSEDVPTVPTPTGLPMGNSGTVRQALQAGLAPVSDSFQVWPDRFRYRFSQTLPTAGQPLEVLREQLDSDLDFSLNQLTPQIPNFQSMVAWCGDLEVNGGSVTATYVFEGPFLPDLLDSTPPNPPTGLVAQAAGGVATLAWDPNGEDDLSGYVVSRGAVAGGPYTPLSPNSASVIPQWETTFVDLEAGTGTWFYVVTAVDATGNESGLSNEAVVETSVDVLVVNGYFDAGNTGYFGAYRNALDALGVAHVAWDPFVDGPVTAGLLASFTDGAVLWPCGYFDGGSPDQLGAARQQLLVDYLEAGGSLLLSGAYVAVSLDGTAFFDDYVHVDPVQFNLDYGNLLGLSGDPVGGGIDLAMASTLYESEVNPSAPAQAAFVYDPVSGTVPLASGGVAISTVEAGPLGTVTEPVHRVVFVAFPFSDLTATSQDQFLASALSWLITPDPCSEPFIRGDANASGGVDVADAVFVLGHLFSGGPPSTILSASDANSDQAVDISDPIYLLTYLFGGGPPPAAPFPTAGCL